MFDFSEVIKEFKEDGYTSDDLMISHIVDRFICNSSYHYNLVNAHIHLILLGEHDENGFITPEEIYMYRGTIEQAFELNYCVFRKVDELPEEEKTLRAEVLALRRQLATGALYAQYIYETKDTLGEALQKAITKITGVEADLNDEGRPIV